MSTTASKITRILRSFEPDIVHLASPFVLGWAGVKAAAALNIPTVAIYQTDVAAFASRYKMPQAAALAAAHIARLHRRATLTLSPSSATDQQLNALQVDRLRRWGRGVDADRFAPEHRSERFRATYGADRVLIGYAGRLSPEKQVADLETLQHIAGAELIIIGDGPDRKKLEHQLPHAHFTGFLGGEDLGRALASIDVFVHPGEAETFCQGVQEALASGTPVVATGSGGPIDLIDNSTTGWLYEPGNLTQMRERVADLVGDHAKRAAFARAARRAVNGRSWAALCERLEAYYLEAQELHQIDRALLTRPRVRPRSEPEPAPPPTWPQWRSYVALGDSITEGLGDSSRMQGGEYYGWATRLGLLLARSAARTPDGTSETDMNFANLAVRSRRVSDMAEQVDRALELTPDLVSMLIGSNNLVAPRVKISALTTELAHQVARLRAAGIDVLLATPFLPRRAVSRVIAGRFAAFNNQIRTIAREQGCLLLDIDTIPEIGDLQNWCEDRVHLASSGHRILAYRAAAVLGVPDAAVLGSLEAALHDEEYGSTGHTIRWLRAHALPWVWRRLRGRTAGDGLSAQLSEYISLTNLSSTPPDTSSHPTHN